MRKIIFFLLFLLTSYPAYAVVNKVPLYELDENSSAAKDDLTYCIDITDTTDGAYGTGKKCTIAEIFKAGDFTINGTNVGLGVVSPTQKLDVNGYINAIGFIGTLQGSVTGNVLGNLTGNVMGDVTGNASTATALVLNPDNCFAGNYPLGVDASGTAEGCTAAPTECSTSSCDLNATTTLSGKSFCFSDGTNCLIGGSGTVSSGTVSRLAKYTASTTVGASSLITDDGTNVGIGTSVPARKLDVSGSGSGTTLTSASAAVVGISNIDTTDNNFSDLTFLTTDSGGSTTIGSKISGVFTDHTAGAVSSDLVFITKNAGTTSEKLRIKNTGNVGIGTSTPTATLQTFNSAGGFAGRAESQNSGTNTAIQVFAIRRSSTGTAAAGLGAMLDWELQNSSGVMKPAFRIVPAWTSASSENAESREIVAIGGVMTTKWVRDSSGGMAFNTSNSPSGTVDIYGAGSSTGRGLATRNSSGTLLTAFLDNGNVGVGSSIPNGRLIVQGSGSTSASMTMQLKDSGGNPLATFLDNGNVGIGTTAPANNLTILSTGTTTLTMNSNGNSSTGRSVFQFLRGNGGWDMSVNVSQDSTDNFAIRALGGPVGGTKVFNILQSSGNIGIGTSTPVNTLDVRGNMAIGSYGGLNSAQSNGLIVSGNVGIGSTVPTQKLDVNGLIKTSQVSGQSAGTLLCVRSDGAIGYCSVAVVGIACTCN